MTRKWYATLRYPKMYQKTKIGIPTSKNKGDMNRTGSGTDGRTDRQCDYYMPPLVPLGEATLKFMNKNKLLSGGGENLTGGGKWGWRGREVGGEREGSGVKGRGKRGLGTPLSTPSVRRRTRLTINNHIYM